jgi:endonuclease YncB( thermonuclease family)
LNQKIAQTVLVVAATLLCASCSAPATSTRQVNAPASSGPRAESRSERISPARTFSGRVVSIEDGDTIIVLDAMNNNRKIRLQGIDAPEGGQAFGDSSRQNLSALIAGEEVTVTWSKRDRYRRIVGKVSVNARDVCLEQIKSGMAWHYKYYQSEQTSEDRALYADAEVEAKTSKRGLWIDSNPIPPWEFRNGR